MPIKKNEKIVAQHIVDFLVGQKIKHVFDLTGGMITFLEDAISKTRGIECVPMHHEQAAGFAAEGYARINGIGGVAIATSGPGATNLITAIGSSYFDSIPTLFITGQVHTDTIKKNENIRQEGFQETDIVSVVKPLTKYAVRVTSPFLVMYEIEKAFYLMGEGRKGSVLVDVPINLQRTIVSSEDVIHFFGSKEHEELLKKSKSRLFSVPLAKVRAFDQLLKQSKRPLIIAGHGVRLSEQVKELHSFSKKNAIPVVTSLLGLDALSHNGANFVGYIGTNGNRHANITLSQADLLIVLGSRLDVRQIGDPKFFNKKVKVVHVDVDASVIGYSIPVDLAFENDLRSFFAAVKSVKVERKEKWLSFIKKISTNFKRDDRESGGINPNIFISNLSECAPEKTIVSVDVGQNQQWCAQSWVVKNNQRILYSGGIGAMGFSLPAAIGAWYADKKRDCLVICGDGGLQINIQELETVSRNKIPLKMFIFNNSTLGMVREFQDLYFNKNYQSTVIGYGNPDFKKIAEAYSLRYVCLDGESDLSLELDKIVALKSPVFVEVKIPMHSSLIPKVVYGKALDDQYPHLSEKDLNLLSLFKRELLS